MNSEQTTAGLKLVSLPGEQWKSSEALGWRYYVSNMGRLASTKYRGCVGRVGIITPALDANGYFRTMLFLNGKYTTVKVHRIVAETWIGPIAPGLTVHHRNFNRADNAVENLEIITLKENIRASAREGRYGKSVGAINGNSKLTEEKVGQIRSRRAQGAFQRVIAEEFGVCRLTVRRILHGRAWRHVA